MKTKKILKNTLKIVLLMIIVVFLAIVALYKNELASLLSVRQIMEENLSHNDGMVLTMNIKGNYYMDELMEQGGVKSDKELIDFATKNLTKGLFKISIEETDIGCSSFTARTQDQEALFARNFDMKTTHIAIIHTAAKGKYKSVSTVDLSFLGIKATDNPKKITKMINMLAAPYTPLDGLNEKGLAVGVYMTYQGPGDENHPTNINTDKKDITSTLLLRLMLDNASNVDEAIEIAKSYDMHDSAGSSYHYMVADSTGKSAILEYLGKSDKTDTDGSKRELKVIENDFNKSNRGQVVTNFVLYDGYYEQDDKRFGLDRYTLLSESLKKSSYILANEQEAMHLLKKVARRNWPSDDSNTITTHSVIYNLDKKQSYLVANEHYDMEEYTYKYKFK